MPLFSKNIQKRFDPYGFTVTRAVFEPPAIALLPSVYQDEMGRRWAVRYRGVAPAFFGYGDVMSCDIVESHTSRPKEKRTLEQVVTNPAGLSRAMAAERRHMCLGLSVVVGVRTSASGGCSSLSLPVVIRPLRRGTKEYNELVSYARHVKACFDAMREATG